MHSVRTVVTVLADERVRSKRWNACALFTSFIITLFNLIALGVPWFYHSSGCDATLLYCVKRNTGFELHAGNGAIVLMLIGFLFQYIATFAVYTRWGGRTSFIPHGPKACATWFALAALSILIAVAIYAGVVNNEEGRPPGKFGPGFGLAIFILVVDTLSSVGVYLARNEIGEGGVAADAPSQRMQEPEPETGGSRKSSGVRGALGVVRNTVSSAHRTWAKAHVHSVVLFFGFVNLVIIIICLGTAWYNEDSGVSAGLIQTFVRLPKTGDLASLRKAGDPAFAFTVLAFFTEFFALMATTIRFLGRNDSFSGRIPHSLGVCVVANALGSLWLLIAFAVYAGRYHIKAPTATLYGEVGGGFALIVLDFILSIIVIIVLICAKKEVSAMSPAAATDAGVGSGARPISGYPDDATAAI